MSHSGEALRTGTGGGRLRRLASWLRDGVGGKPILLLELRTCPTGLLRKKGALGAHMAGIGRQLTRIRDELIPQSSHPSDVGGGARGEELDELLVQQTRGETVSRDGGGERGRGVQMVEFVVGMVGGGSGRAAGRSGTLLVRIGRLTLIHSALVFFPLEGLDNIRISPALMRLVILRVLEQNFVHISRRVLEEFAPGVEDDERDLAVAQHRQLVRLLHQPELPFRERHLTIPFVLNPRDLDFLPSHTFRFVQSFLRVLFSTPSNGVQGFFVWNPRLVKKVMVSRFNRRDDRRQENRKIFPINRRYCTANTGTGIMRKCFLLR